MNYQSSLNILNQAGKTIITTQLTRKLESNLHILTQISNRLISFEGKKPDTLEKRFVYYRFVKWIDSNKTFELGFKKRELKHLSFSLDYTEEQGKSILNNRQLLLAALEIFRESWSYRFLPGILYCYLSNWNSNDLSGLNTLGLFLKEQIVKYDGNNRKLLTLKDNLAYLDHDSGDLAFGYALAVGGLLPVKGTNALMLPDYWIGTDYFCGVIQGYLDKVKSDIEPHLEGIIEFLSMHTNETKGHFTSLLVLSKIITNCKDSDEALQEKIKHHAIKLIGDPGNSPYWNLSRDIRPKDTAQIKDAKNILNTWIVRQFITVFFEKCINDKRRKEFWLKYVNKISDYRIVGSEYIKTILKHDTRVRDIITSRFVRTNSVGDRNASLMFAVEDYLFVEFSDSGSFYAYKQTNRNAPKITSSYFNSMSDLKRPELDLLVRRSGWSITSTSTEGRLMHVDGDMSWEDVFDFWLTKIAGINV